MHLRKACKPEECHPRFIRCFLLTKVVEIEVKSAMKSNIEPDMTNCDVNVSSCSYFCIDKLKILSFPVVLLS